MPIYNHTQRQPRKERPRREYQVPDTQEARAHAEDAVNLREDLKDYGVDPQMVAPTRSGEGHVRLNFDQANQLLSKIYKLEDKVEALQKEIDELRQNAS